MSQQIPFRLDGNGQTYKTGELPMLKLRTLIVIIAVLVFVPVFTGCPMNGPTMYCDHCNEYPCECPVNCQECGEDPCVCTTGCQECGEDPCVCTTGCQECERDPCVCNVVIRSRTIGVYTVELHVDESIAQYIYSWESEFNSIPEDVFSIIAENISIVHQAAWLGDDHPTFREWDVDAYDRIILRRDFRTGNPLLVDIKWALEDAFGIEFPEHFIWVHFRWDWHPHGGSGNINFVRAESNDNISNEQIQQMVNEADVGAEPGDARPGDVISEVRFVSDVPTGLSASSLSASRGIRVNLGAGIRDGQPYAILYVDGTSGLSFSDELRLAYFWIQEQ